MVGETVEKKLYNAASEGDVATLKQLLQEDPYLVHEAPFPCSRNVLHVAAMYGQEAIVEEVLRMNPRLARIPDSQKSSPLHIAAAEGHIKIASKLLSVAPEMCWWRDDQNMNPVHVAAMNGRVEIVEHLLGESPLPAMERLDRAQTVFHLCVKHGQLTTLKVLVQKLGDLVAAKDDDGETLLHLAVRSNQLEIVKYLVEDKITTMRTPNSMGKTELKILRESPRDKSRYSEIKNMLKKLPDSSKMLPARMADSVIVALVLIATMAFQAAVAPPGGVWDENKDGHKAGEAILGNGTLYNVFVVFNTIAFAVSLLTILLIMTGLPSRSHFFSYLAMISMFASSLSVTGTYIYSILTLTPGEEPPVVSYLFSAIFILGALAAIYFLYKGPVSAMRE